MKIITGISKKNFTKTIKIIIFKKKYIFSKYAILRYHKIIYIINDRRKEIMYNDILLIILNLNKNNQIIQIIK